MPVHFAAAAAGLSSWPGRTDTSRPAEGRTGLETVLGYLRELSGETKGRPTLASVTAGVSAAGYWDARSSVSGWARR